ncbi:MAG TPA: patatin-like phospholipase family protein [Thermoanaerobaculia bacterium]|nr:patatin-like phospholipase family protein [Thermoanaerobaculia bacterium]HQN07243.1 patatin-like phospholipase family protein [Thermoanaerobaculia bacterium]HQP84898.1 patatin-like phospholipase family protein [Thermoanaerobaculia bacterium]
MSRTAWGAIALVGVLSAPPARAQPVESAAERPTVGLVLSGGSAHGLAHVGVLKVLHELRIPVDVVTGTSMGSIVGGLYAAGMSPPEMEWLMGTIDWEDILDDRPSRDRLSFRRKQDEMPSYVDLEMGLTTRGLAFPSGLIAGQKLGFLLKSLTLGTVGIEEFDDLPIPFRCIATDIATGEKVVLAGGSLAEAIRASMSIPGVFSPVPRGDRLLVDGGLVDNLPVGEARDLGADVVIAVDVSSDKFDMEKLKSFGGVLSRMTSLPVVRNVSVSAPRANVVLTPRVGDIPSMGFSRAAEIVARGEEEARRLAKVLSALSVPEEEYRAHRERIRGRRVDRIIVDEIQTVSVGVDPRQVRARLESRPGKPLDVGTLRRDLDRIYEMGVFETVEFRILRDEGRHVLVIDARPKSWGPTFVRVGSGFEADFDGDATVALRGTLHAMQLNSRGGEVKATLELGTVPGLNVEYYQPLDFRGRTFFSVDGSFVRTLARVSTPDGLVGEGRITLLQGSVDAGLSLGSWGQVRAGVFRGAGRGEPLVTNVPIDDLELDVGGLFAQASVDTLDDLSFPRRGTLAIAAVEAYRPDLGSESSFNRLILRGTQAISVGRRTALHLTGGWEDTMGSHPPFYLLFSLSDFTRLAALSREEATGERAAYAAAVVQRRIASLPTRVGRGVYLGGAFEAGRVWARREDVGFDGIRPAGGLFVGADTVLGPIYAGFGVGYGGNTTLYVFLGRPY